MVLFGKLWIDGKNMDGTWLLISISVSFLAVSVLFFCSGAIPA